MARRLETENYFTVVEQETIAYYRGLLIQGQAYLGNRPFLSREAKIVLMVEGLDPLKQTTIEELGSVWGFYNIDLKPNGNLNSLARQLGIRSERVNSKKLSPKQKFGIYTRALLLCLSDEISPEEVASN